MSPVDCRAYWRETPKGGREGERDGQEPNHTTARIPGPLEIIQYSLQLTGYGEGADEDKENGRV